MEAPSQRGTAETIARVVRDLKRGEYLRQKEGWDGTACPRDAEIIDATAIYQNAIAGGSVWVYEDHPCIAPPWQDAAIGYVNEHGNVNVMVLSTMSFDDVGRKKAAAWEGANPEMEWDRVAWICTITVWMGGWSATKNMPFPTSGPFHLFQFAIYADGEPADLHWVQIRPDLDMKMWDNCQLVVLGVLNFLNCNNVELVVPHRPRPEQRRVFRTGQVVKTLSVYPAGKRTTSAQGERLGGQPLTTVRGHFARYGEEHGRGLLFGKYSGRFWIGQHARGERELGEVSKTYVLKDR